jgi:hypothetical protein
MPDPRALRHGAQGEARPARRALERLLGVGPGPSPAPTPGPGQPGGIAPDAPALPRFVSGRARVLAHALAPARRRRRRHGRAANSGEDPHNLVVSPEGTHTPLVSFSELEPGTYERRPVTLPPGRYRLWCSLESHEALGMSTTLGVQ